MFIRAKRIKGNDYAYLVQNIWTNEGSRQRSKQYLGRIFNLAPEGKGSFLDYASQDKEYLLKAQYKDIIKDLIVFELHKHGFKKKGDELCKEGITYNAESSSVARRGREIVLQLNQGYLCQETIKNLINYEFKPDSGYAMANLLTEAGIAIEKDMFIAVYEKLSSEQANKETKEAFKEFYY